MATAKPMTKHTTNRRAFAPRLFPIRITPFLHGVKREWLTACLQQTTAGSFPAFFIIRAVSIYVNVFHASPGISRSFSPVLARKISSQYQTSTTRFLTCAKDRATPGLPHSLVLSPTSTPKPCAEGRWPPVALCRAGLGSPPRSLLGAPHWGAAPQPAAETQVLLPLPKKSGIAFAVPGFFVSVRNDLAMKCGRRLLHRVPSLRRPAYCLLW